MVTISYIGRIIGFIVFILFLALIMKNRFTLLKFYLTVVSLVGVIGLAVGYGVGIYNGVQAAVISDEEYIAGQGRYTLDVCKQPNYSTVKPNEQPVPPTDEQIAKCETETRESLIVQRNYTMKQNVIGGLVWGTLALILFLVHYPMLIKKSREEIEN